MIGVLLRTLLTDSESPVARVARSLAAMGPSTPADIGRDTGLARSTISSALTELRDAGVVQALDIQSNPLGRPSQRHALNPSAGRCAGVLLGLAEVRIALCDVAHNVLAETSVPMMPGYAPEAAAAALNRHLGALCGEQGFPLGDLLGVGLAVSAPVSSQGIVLSGSILPSWHGTDLARTFGAALGCPIHAANESNCGALAEMMWGAAQGETDFVLFKCSLGIGGAVVIDGRVRMGAFGQAGEFGHMVLDPAGPLCVCGKRGCLEAMVGGARLLRLAHEVEPGLAGLPDLVARAGAGHAGFSRLLDDAADAIGRALGLIGTTIDPALFLIAGEMALAGEPFLDRIRATHDRQAPIRHATRGPRLALGRFLGNDTVLGAVALVLRREGRVT